MYWFGSPSAEDKASLQPSFSVYMTLTSKASGQRYPGNDELNCPRSKMGHQVSALHLAALGKQDALKEFTAHAGRAGVDLSFQRL